ncbi:alpha-1,2-mannosyltransferase ALG9-like [Scylla paramamosain]|uniref:alpha-1,2-mannosyltransferase ALG9-like n=1 Tax=Scylla paramamosain TaxID=85552 RepID=UPI00308326E4
MAARRGEGEAWSPTSYTALKALLSARLCAAIWSSVADCDETFNYWEPTHYFIYGRGLQTWEYSPSYALRSYTYILLHAVPGKVYATLLQYNRMLVFFFIRCLLALGCSGCELYFYRGVCKEFGSLVGSLTIGIMIFSAGMFGASTALLPSSFAMYMTLLSMGAWYQKCPQLAIFTTAISTFLGWPFAAALGLPIAFDILMRKKEITIFIKWCLISVITILVPMVQIDSHLYGRLVVAPLNIVLYNVFSSGSSLYGTEPWSFYILNGFLNFNIVFLSALLLPLLLCVSYFIDKQGRSGQAGTGSLPHWLAVSPLYLWLSIFLAQPHKEERFLFPAYPLVALSGALAVEYGQRLWRACMQAMCARKRNTRANTHWFAIVFLVVTSLLSLSRIVGQYRAYHAPLETYMELNRVASESELPSHLPINVCVGKEWYRFPSSFFLPGLKLRSSFQLAL